MTILDTYSLKSSYISALDCHVNWSSLYCEKISFKNVQNIISSLYLVSM